MVQVTKEEKAAIVKRFPDAHIVRTMRGDSKRGHYYVEETRKIMAFLKEFRNAGVVATFS